MPPANEAPPSSKVPGVKGVAAKDWLDGARGMLTTKIANMVTKTANVTAKAAEVATTETPSAVSRRHSRWSERQTQSDRRR